MSQRTTPGGRQIVAVVRLTISTEGGLQYGEAIDAETERSRGFSSWAGLVQCLGDLITERRRDAQSIAQQGIAARHGSADVGHHPQEKGKPS